MCTIVWGFPKKATPNSTPSGEAAGNRLLCPRFSRHGCQQLHPETAGKEARYPSSALLPFCWEVSPTKIDYSKKVGTLILTSGGPGEGIGRIRKPVAKSQERGKAKRAVRLEKEREEPGAEKERAIRVQASLAVSLVLLAPRVGGG